ncbi:MAG: hypothetical protein HN742_42660 [Lentisphaerae bacterium]|nr:hypothetical protein [Lentisphaerota bacterium]MBT4823187.1 hypothetical protein [Lentisphaerota bacterium]MBT5605291.1 hypothetical protein [Lentisphaerota bacterium]MBT7054536.1 hypothetical protein [Lentisphaerota bacterium]MBT7848641.1 hypothetical protein [Lentisphaerota bacterium]
MSVRFELEKLGLADTKLTAFDALTEEPVTMDDDGKVSMSLGKEEWAYIWL